jgi:hypothetical protein
MPPPIIRRYTELPYVVHALSTRTLTLVSPKRWDDKNDAHNLEWYRKKKRLRAVLAMCLTEAEQTYHHWRIFTAGASGACIEFDKRRFVDWVDSTPRLSGGTAAYRTLDNVRKFPPCIDDLPLLKRSGYKDEKEWRVIYEDSKKAVSFKDFPFDLALISQITINPWLPLPVARSIAESLRSLQGCESLVVRRATLIENDEWQRIARAAMA